MPAILLIIQQYLQHYFWIIKNIAESIILLATLPEILSATVPAILQIQQILLAILVISNISGIILSNIADNVADSAILPFDHTSRWNILLYWIAFLSAMSFWMKICCKQFSQWIHKLRSYFVSITTPRPLSIMNALWQHIIFYLISYKRMEHN